MRPLIGYNLVIIAINQKSLALHRTRGLLCEAASKFFSSLSVNNKQLTKQIHFFMVCTDYK